MGERVSHDEAMAAMHAIIRGDTVLHVPPQAGDADIVLDRYIEQQRAQEDRVAELEALLGQARTIIDDVSPGYTVWLDAADAALEAAP